MQFKIGDRVIPKLDVWKKSPDYTKSKNPPTFRVVGRGFVDFGGDNARYYCEAKGVNIHLFTGSDLLKEPA